MFSRHCKLDLLHSLMLPPKGPALHIHLNNLKITKNYKKQKKQQQKDNDKDKNNWQLMSHVTSQRAPSAHPSEQPKLCKNNKNNNKQQQRDNDRDKNKWQNSCHMLPPKGPPLHIHLNKMKTTKITKRQWQRQRQRQWQISYLVLPPKGPLCTSIWTKWKQRK